MRAVGDGVSLRKAVIKKLATFTGKLRTKHLSLESF